MFVNAQVSGTLCPLTPAHSPSMDLGPRLTSCTDSPRRVAHVCTCLHPHTHLPPTQGCTTLTHTPAALSVGSGRRYILPFWSDTLQEVSALKLEAFSTPSPPLPGPGFHGRQVWLILALGVVESSSFLLAHSKAVVLGWEALPPRGQLWYQDCGAEAALGMLADALRCPGKLFLLPLITTWP